MMRFYNYVFAAGYESEIRNERYFIPWCFPLGEVFSIMCTQIFTIFYLFERWELLEFTEPVSKIIIGFTSIGLLIYYLRHKRHRQIWMKYHPRLKSKNGVELWLIYFCPAVISFSLMFMAVLYNQHAWIFE